MSAVADALAGAAPRILTIDLERQSGLARIFDAKVRGGYIHPAKWTRLPSTLCFSAKWLDRKAVEFRSVWDDPAALLERSWQLYDEADIVVTYNGRRADNRWLRDDWAVAGKPPPRPWRDVDLYVVNKSLFGFESASLDHLCQRLGLPRKVDHYDPAVADLAAAGDVKAQRRLRRYNVGDVKATEAAYLRLLPWMTNHPPVGLWTGDPRCCPNCGGTELTRVGYHRTPLTSFAQYRCQGCGAVARNNFVKSRVEMRGAR